MAEKRVKLARMIPSLRQNVSSQCAPVASQGVPPRWPEILLFWNHRFLEGVRMLGAALV